MPRNSEYWRRRYETLEASQHAEASALASDWQGEYDRAAARIQRDTDAWYQRVADNNEISMADARRLLDSRGLKEFKWTLEEFEAKARENGDLRWQKELENASARQHISWLQRERIMLDQEVNALFSGKQDKAAVFFGDTYAEARNRSAYEIQLGTGCGQPLRNIDSASIDKVLYKPWTADGRTFSDRIWGNQESLKSELRMALTQGIIRGDHPDVVSNTLAQKMGVSKANAARLVYTESAYFRELGTLESYREHSIDQLEILGTLDSVTCSECGALDGKIIALKDAEVGVTVPVFHPRCRCTTVPFFDDMKSVGKRVARGEDGDQYFVPPDTTYAQWAKEQARRRENAKQETAQKPEAAATAREITKNVLQSERESSIITTGGAKMDDVTGASGAIPRDDLARMDAHAERFYEEIRKRTSDVVAIAQNTGLPSGDIARVKQHIFLDVHDLGDEAMERFTPDYDMAVSWQRLIEGTNIQEMDMVLLRHEMLEQELMAHGAPYFEAHKKAEAVHNYTQHIKRLDKEAGV